MHSETNILDFINHDCPSNDVSVAFLKTRLSTLEEKLQEDEVTDIDLEKHDQLAAKYAQAKQFLCYA